MDIGRREFLHSAAAMLALPFGAGALALGAHAEPPPLIPGRDMISAHAAYQRYPGARWCRGTHRTVRGPVSSVVRNYAQEPAMLPRAA